MTGYVTVSLRNSFLVLAGYRFDFGKDGLAHYSSVSPGQESTILVWRCRAGGRSIEPSCCGSSLVGCESNPETRGG